MSRTSANNWARGYKTYRRGEAVGFVDETDYDNDVFDPDDCDEMDDAM